MSENTNHNQSNVDYINGLVAKFNENKEDDSLSSSEKTFLQKLFDINSEVNETAKKLMKKRAEVEFLRGKANGFVDALGAIKSC